MRLRGVALRLTVAYHETKDSPFGEQRELHRQVMRSLRSLKEAIPSNDLNAWMIGEAEAAGVPWTTMVTSMPRMITSQCR